MTKYQKLRRRIKKVKKTVSLGFEKLNIIKRFKKYKDGDRYTEFKNGDRYIKVSDIASSSYSKFKDNSETCKGINKIIIRYFIIPITSYVIIPLTSDYAIPITMGVVYCVNDTARHKGKVTIVSTANSIVILWVVREGLIYTYVKYKEILKSSEKVYPMMKWTWKLLPEPFRTSVALKAEWLDLLFIRTFVIQRKKRLFLWF